MELKTIQMERAMARRHFLDYRAAVRERHGEEDAEIMRGYRALAKGQQLIKLSETIAAGGFELKSRTNAAAPVLVPKLAVMAADQKWCWLLTQADGSLQFKAHDSWRSKKAERVEFPAGTFAGLSHSRDNFRALVPPIPPRLRPTIALSNFHILWEAEWQRCAPKDPALLRHIGGDLYAVLAVWDLTELERAVLMGRFRA
jgi:hypothetical protein